MRSNVLAGKLCRLHRDQRMSRQALQCTRGAFNGVVCLLIKVIVGRTGVAAKPVIDGESVDP